MMINVIKVLIPIGAIALLCVMLNLINAKKNRRIRQFPIIGISTILMVVAVVVLINNFGFTDNLIGSHSFFQNSNLVIVNLVLLIGFFAIKLIIRPICSAVFKKRNILETFSLTIYVYNEDYEEWFLKKQWKNFRKFFFGLLCGLVIVSGVYLGLTWLMGKESLLWFMFFPCAAVAVINEIYGYVNGQTLEEYEYSVLGEDSSSRKVSKYYKLRVILEQLLPSPLLSGYTGCEFIQRNSSADFIRKMKETDDTVDLITSEYFEMNNRYKTADVDHVQATLDMMHRKNVVFFNPFYRDISMYVTLPMARSLLDGKKCVVLCSRNNTADDVKKWLTEILCEYSHMKQLWRVNNLSDKAPECEVGILTFTQLYDKRVININRDFFHETDFVLLIEPSFMMITGQVALSILSEEMSVNEERPVYCVCDRYADGLIDTLSHLIRAEITDVIAMPVPRCNYTTMSWDADGDFCRQNFFDKQTKYLGNAVEIASIAVKNQIPYVTWYSEKKIPVRDVKWIAGQYYSTICRFMNQPCQQKSLYEKIHFVSSLWSSEKTKEQFLIVEDEFCNMFSMMRTYLSRGTDQVFVNVLSENYLLRDYMRCNRAMFASNPNAIPSFVPDYAKTDRNTILKLIIMMTLKPITEEEILKEFHLIGIETNDAYQVLLSLLKKYTYADDNIFSVSAIRKNIDDFMSTSMSVYSVSEEEFEKYFSDSLKNAYYILEDEKDEEGFIDVKMFSHVTQTILPGQFVTYDGKYYQAKYVSPQSGVVLRRASDQFNGRKYYRQIREYFFDFSTNSEIVSNRKMIDIEFVELRTDFSVATTGYLEMNDNHNLRTARMIDFSADPTVDNYTRRYHNKSVLRIKLPESDDKICFTICLLLTEVFRSVFPDGWQYLAAVTKRPDNIDGMLNYVVYPARGDIESGYIYIIEDSDIDLGLLDAVQKNFVRLMEVIADFLEWHFEKMREPASKDPVPVQITLAEAEKRKRRNLVLRMLDRIRKLFGGKKEEKVEIKSTEQIESGANEEKNPSDVTNDSETQAEEENGVFELGGDTDNNTNTDSEKENIVAPSSEGDEEYVLGEDTKNEKLEQNDSSDSEKSEDSIRVSYEEDELEETDPELLDTDATDIFEEDAQAPIDYRIEEQLKAFAPIEKTRYQRECFLKYGYEEVDKRICADKLMKYLRVRGWCNNSLTLARNRDILAKSQLDLNAENFCDFCSLPLTGVSYEVLNDGRIRCNDCSASAITKLEDFKQLFYSTLGLMEDFFDIHYRIPISIITTNAREIAKGSGRVFRPSTEVAERVLGFAQKKSGRYALVIENGSPRLATIDTTVHEMTHIWQYINWNDSDVARIYGMSRNECTLRARDIVYEGMAMWASVQYLYQIGETYYAAEQEALAESRDDVYGVGFRLYREQYPFIKDSSLLKYTPFSTFPTLEPSAVINAACSMCTEVRCICKGS